MLIIISTWKMQNFLACQLAGKLTGAAVVGGDRKHGRDDKATPALLATQV